MPEIERFVSARRVGGPSSSVMSFWDHRGYFGVSAEELESILAEDEEKPWSTRTWSRALVEKIFQQFLWYNPQKDLPNAPRLRRAWAYYEHITLARHFVTETTGQGTLVRAEPGETSDTKLYDWFTTPQSALNEWGIGIAAYFTMVRSFAIILFLAGLINIPNINYYRSSAHDGERGIAGILPYTLKSTAVCTDREWVVCTDCNSPYWEEEWDTEAGRNRFAHPVQNDQNSNITLIHKTLCQGAQLEQGMVNYSTLMFLIIAIGVMTLIQRKREIRFDEQKLTSTDYSVRVSNPPPDAYDPNQWHDFFEQLTQRNVAVVTVALDNAELLRILYLRRLFIDKLRRRLPDGTDMNGEEELNKAIENYVERHKKRKLGCVGKLFFCLVVPFLRPFNFFLPVDVLRDRIKEFGEKAKDAQKKKYKVAEIYVTFETEEGQRAALKALNCSKFNIWRQNKNAVASKARFQNKTLKVCRPAEPNTIRWLDLQVPLYRKYLMRLVNFIAIIGLTSLSGFVITKCRRNLELKWYGVIVSIFNSLVPTVARLLVLFESHTNEGLVQKSMYMKITIFRWFNGVLLTVYVTPLSSFLGEGKSELLPAINSVLLSELMVTPLLRLLDLSGFIRKHIIAPRAETQEQMNKMFCGTYYNIGERYTDLSKVLFLVFFYSSMDSDIFFIGSAILFIQYYTDKFCLVRTWKSAPFIGTEISRYSRRYFVPTALLFMAVASSYFWAAYPFDDLCKPSHPTGGFEGVYNDVKVANGTISNLTAKVDEEVVQCQQQALYLPGLSFPAVPKTLQGAGPNEGKSWMTPSQEKLTRIYGWSSVIVLIIWIILIFSVFLMTTVRSWIFGTYSEPKTGDKKVDFSNVPEISAYIPQIRDATLPFPVLACDVDSIPQTLIGWNDENHSYDFHNMLFDVPRQGMKRSKMTGNTRGVTNISDCSEYKVKSRGYGATDDMSGDEERESDIFISDTPIFSIVKHWPPEWQKTQEWWKNNF